MDDNNIRLVDELLDASLRRYADAEPRAGLEGRILAGTRARRRAQHRRMAWAWALAVAAAAVALLVVARPRRQSPPAPVAAETPAPLRAPVAARAAPPAPPPVPRRPRRHTAPRTVDLRPQEFPTPRPLSEQEKLLLAYAEALQQASAVAAPKANIDFEREMVIPPITIAEIKIKPLELPGKAGEDPGAR